MDISLEVILKQLESLATNTLRLLPNLLIAVIVFALFWFLAKGIRTLIKRLTRRRERGRRLGAVLSRLSQSIIILIGLFVALSIVIPSFRPGDLVELLGISGVAIGFAFRDILQNFLAGILILLTEPFNVDDQIVYKDIEGTVERIQTRATIVRTYDGRRVVIPNGEIFTNYITVNTAAEKRRLEYDFGIGYGDSIQNAKQIMLNTMQNLDGVLKDPPPEALVLELADCTINIRARWWIDPPLRADEVSAKDTVLTALTEALVEAGIDLPFPTQQILFHDQTEETDGDRTRQREGWPANRNGNNPKTRRIADALSQLTPRSNSSPENTIKADKP